MAAQIYKSPNRFLFIASIGNPAPYTGTRHSAGHVLLDAIQSQLHERIGLTAASSASSLSKSIFYSTWKSPSLMNVSGPPVLRQFKSWVADRLKYFNNLSNNPSTSSDAKDEHTIQVLKPPSTPISIDTRALKHRFRPTLVILHDELEAQPGQIKVRRGGPQQASLRGHRGLISIMESLRGAGLLPSSSSSTTKNLAILRIGIGIGRPSSRERNSVSDYVLAKMGAQELQALGDAVPGVVDVLVQEMYRRDEDEL
jgi:peptidyl-tRNA hydrolase, PTH1 family